MQSKIMAISVAKVRTLIQKGNQGALVSSAIHKSAVSTLANPAAQEIDQYGFKEDEQADLRVHGGVDKAIYAYPEENYSFWAEILQREVRHGTLFPWFGWRKLDYTGTNRRNSFRCRSMENWRGALPSNAI